jgi:PAS domain-containing protein
MRRAFDVLRARPRAAGDALHLLAAALESVDDAIVVCTRDGRVWNLNRHAREMLGAGCDARGSDPEAWVRALRPRVASGLLMPPEDLPPLRALNGEVVKGIDVLVSLGSKDVLLEVGARPANDARGRTRGVVVTLRDVTAARSAEARLRASGNPAEAPPWFRRAARG